MRGAERDSYLSLFVLFMVLESPGMGARGMEQYPRRDMLSSRGKNKNRAYRELYEWVEVAVVSVLSIVVLFTFVFRFVGVDGNSMKPTLQHRDWLLVSGFLYEPKAGDVVVVTQQQDPEHPLIKRIIATEHQEVDIDFDAGVVYVDGAALDEPYVNAPTTSKYDLNFPQTVPEGHVFLLGDNRNESLDSRSSAVGMVDERYIMGRAIFRLLPINQIGRVE